MLLCIIKFEIYLYSSTYFFLAFVMYLQISFAPIIYLAKYLKLMRTRMINKPFYVIIMRMDKGIKVAMISENGTEFNFRVNFK